jgi:hypothetical protein
MGIYYFVQQEMRSELHDGMDYDLSIAIYIYIYSRLPSIQPNVAEGQAR